MTDENSPPDSLLSPAAFGMALDTPWKAVNEIERLLLWPLARLSFAAAGVRWGPGWRLYGLPLIQKHRQSSISIGPRAWLRSTLRSNPLGPDHAVILSTRRAGAVLQIGADFGMTGGSIVAEQRITIGDRVMVGANTVITDSDFHPLDPARRQSDINDGALAPVVIEDDVFIGMQCLILKGASLGAGCVIGAGSVVTGTIAAGAIAAGNPARVIRSSEA